MESPVIQFLRGFVLLSMLIAVPCIAVGWNQFAEIDWQQVLHVQKTESGHSQKTIPAATQAANFHVQNAPPVEKPNSAVCLVEPALPQTPSLPAVTTVPPAASAVQQVAWQDGNVPYGNRQVEQQQAAKTQNFKTLEEHLKLLGVKSYKLEKWGSEGNLFRFSCLAAASGEYQYEKQFQEIGEDEMNVMQAVIGQIEKWKAGL